MSENNNENLDELEAQLQASLNEIRAKKEKLRLYTEVYDQALAEDVRRDEYKRIQQEIEDRKNTPVVVTAHSIVDHINVLFTVDNLREDVARWLRNTFVISQSYKHPELSNAYTIPAVNWNLIPLTLSKIPNVSVEYNQNMLEEIELAKNAPHFTIDTHNDGFKVIIHPTAPYYSENKIKSIPGAKPVAGTHAKEWIIPFIYSFILINQLNDADKVKFTKHADERIKTELEFRDELDRIAKLEDTNDIAVEFNNDIVPRAFQKVGALFGVKRKGNLIIADEMGLGKTLQSILIGKLLGTRDLIVCPAGLKENWYREIFKLLGVNAVVMSGAQPDENDMITLLINKPPVVIINYDLIGRAVDIKGQTKTRVNDDGSVEKVKDADRTVWPWVELLNRCDFDRVTYDEGHKLKNPDSKRSQASRLITIPAVTILTGTPITNRPQEYWPLLKLIAPNEIPNFDAFTARYVSIDGKRAANIEELRHLVKPFMIRRTKKQVVADLPPIIRTTVYHNLTDTARQRYKKAEEGLYEILAAYNPEREGEEELIPSILTQILRMKQICALDKVEATCDLALTILDSFEEDELNNKLIIFTQHVDLVEQFRRRMSGDFGTVAFTGETPMNKRYEYCDAFQTDPAIRVLVTTVRTASEGLTLTRGGAVIFNDFEWTPAAHEQAEARCYGRLNDMHGARSYYHAAANTVEDMIQELLLRKMAIIEQVVDGVQIAREQDTSILKEIIKRLKER